ncbi:hypothetical protein [Microbacterium sp. 18062]|uniref:hypothetical protein n=1 Tax=Microbacterium sp. 18062 TaxID=2681410 RepID=UPI001358BB91|nr:hypothetical protein [Microbacterium sp. 18062]
MTFDEQTAAVMAVIVTVSVSLTFIATSLSSRYGSAGARLWGLTYLLGMVAVLCNIVSYLAVSSVWGTGWAIALGNGAGVAAIGCLLLGLRAYNGSPVQGPALMVVALAFLTVAATVVDAPRPGGAGGTIVTYLSLVLVSVGAALHAAIGRTRRYVMAWVLAGCMTAQALFYLGRAVVSVWEGTESTAFVTWFGAVPGYLMLVSIGLVATIAIFVLRSVLAGESAAGAASPDPDAVLDADAFLSTLRGVLRRASSRTELVVVVAVLVEDVGTITASFGHEVADATTRVLRSAAREYASPVAVVGESADSTIVLVATTASSPADARRQAGLLYRGVVQRFVSARGIVVPGVGVGVALSQTLGYSPETLVEGATIAAVDAGGSDETSVVFATARSFPVSPFPAETE